jgi:5-oxoprolinase (ATP-hydrolysing)
MAWPTADDIFRGFQLRIVRTGFTSTIERIEMNSNVIHVKDRLPRLNSDEVIEVSSNEEVPVLAARLLTQTPLTGQFPKIEMRLGSTRGTNAILERKGAKTALLITRGFKDLLLIGNQQRSDLFALHIVKTMPLYDCVIEIDERIDASGNVVRSIDKQKITQVVAQLKGRKVESVAVALLNAYRNPIHETEVVRLLKTSGFNFSSSSHALSSQIKILQRAETTVANAYLEPIIHTYVAGIQKGLASGNLRIMTSAGNLVHAGNFFPKDSLLSGPAGGVVGAADQAGISGVQKFIAFDMGGTSTDVSLFNKRFDYRYESIVGDFKILSPSVAVDTIAAGGGSICDFDGYRLTVGPESAGAKPGPACYGSGGPLTITDVNLLLGRIDATRFPIPVYIKNAEAALDSLLLKIQKTTGHRGKPEQILDSLIQIANEKMAKAIKKISVQQGHDPSEFTLLSFGGAGGQHACALADTLDMKSVLVPYDAGLLSAHGIGHAAIEKFEEKLILQPLRSFSLHMSDMLAATFARAKQALIDEGFAAVEIKQRKSLLYLRFEGQESSLEIEYEPGDDIIAGFRRRYESIFGHWIDHEIEVESIRVIASVGPRDKRHPIKKLKRYRPEGKPHLFRSDGKKVKGSVYRWEDLNRGALIDGPALVVSGNSTTFVDIGWRWILDGANNARLEKKNFGKPSALHSKEAQLELFTNRFTALAEEMGALLQRTSFSVNVKERLDFSCAVLDAQGFLVVNAPHIPVHLGSMGVCVREVSKSIVMRKGDVIITNHPAFGGSHLPDVTLIKPVYFKNKLVGFVANRAHHAEIGGIKPGSMPAGATHLEEEGVIIPPTYLVRNGKAQWKSIRQIFLGAKYPTRAIEENLADLNGALAAVYLGERGLMGMFGKYGAKEVSRQMIALRIHAASLLKSRIKTLARSSYQAIERLDDGAVLNIKITRHQEKLTIDFSGSSHQHPGNLNATKAIVQSVVLYCLRLLVKKTLPMNEGLMEPVRLIVPPGLLNPDFSKKPPAVVGGNTEVSQRLTDTFLKAFELAACSQGTMNNFLFGNERFGYYETICGGTGGGPGFEGTDAVHQHMTNTRITDPEVLELRYPVRIERFEIRRGSGGNGMWQGGDGVTRELVFNEPLEINILSQHRKERPYGMKGGGPGKPGTQIIVRASGTKEQLGGMASASVNAGDRLIISTPGGGGWGTKNLI